MSGVAVNIPFNQECDIIANGLATTVSTTCMGKNPCCVPAASSLKGAFPGDGTKGVCIPAGCPVNTPVLVSTSAVYTSSPTY